MACPWAQEVLQRPVDLTGLKCGHAALSTSLDDRAVFLKGTMKKVGVALIGAGLIGKEVVRLVSSPSLRQVFDIVLLSNSKHAVLLEANTQLDGNALLTLLPPSSSALPPSSPRATYLPADPARLVDLLANQSRETSHHIILVDCTSSDAVASLYPHAISSSLSVVTPNKRAFSASASLYDDIRIALRRPGAGLCYYEATCGAGLPVLTTVRDLLATGDEVVKVEAVLSGTLSYLFNQYSTVEAPKERIAFSELVRDAWKHGHTEPHPADDLSGRDVARKLAILARLASPSSSNLPDGFASIDTQSLVPANLADVADPAAFVDGLAKHDEEFERLRRGAESEGKVLRYVGLLDRATGTTKCGLEIFAHSHPFASLSGSYLSLAIYTRRYSSSPLIIRGPGYPLSVTAGAVVADAVRVAERYGARVGL
ncbi:bifunctional aspartokinase / homoserine dehydrogenase 2 [Rhodotorula toruloides]|uniref:Homoserine dehydrogenase n=1 Tax=Rhodotorula toruloides TaxID=5286 RepID=A0A511K858_RHOTO|nr:bifunctional aspartokinase / homoserine dehydrogenase 2 [Rhodotorula toruloides]